MKIKYLALYIISLLLYSSCNRINKSENKLVDGKKLELNYANGFNIIDYGNYKIVIIKNPWQKANGVEYKYVLIEKNKKLPGYLKDYTIIRTPIERVVCLSTTHIAFIDVLNKTNTIVGVSGSEYVNNTKVRSAIEQKKVFDVGYDSNLNYELITSLNPDLVITYGIGGQVSSYNQKLKDLGIKTIINAEYLENSPLGKLEWIKLIACFYNEQELADNYFNKVEKDYNQLVQLTKDVKSKPKVLLGLPWKDVWYVPGGNSYLAKMIKQAGGEYIWSENESRESLPFDIETVFGKASNADDWLNTGTVNNKQDILKIDERFVSFKPFHKAKIFNNNLQMNESGGNNYWEKGLVEPQIVLMDMIHIFHPELLPDHKLVYYKIIE